MEESLESEMSTESFSNKITELDPNERNQSTEYDRTVIAVSNAGDVTNQKRSKRPEHRKNLPGLQQHVATAESHVELSEKKSHKLTVTSATSSPDPSSSPEVSKRRRIQHDYRRLSSAGYLDDYETRNQRRFSSESDPSLSPSPVKTKSNNSTPTKLLTPEFPSVPRVKLKLKLLKNDGDESQQSENKGKFVGLNTCLAGNAVWLFADAQSIGCLNHKEAGP